MGGSGAVCPAGTALWSCPLAPAREASTLIFGGHSPPYPAMKPEPAEKRLGRSYRAWCCEPGGMRGRQVVRYKKPVSKAAAPILIT